MSNYKRKYLRPRLISKRGLRNHCKRVKRDKYRKSLLFGYYRHINNVKQNALSKEITYRPRHRDIIKQRRTPTSLPQYPRTLKFLSETPRLFTKNSYPIFSKNIYVPRCFSFIDNYKESFEFLSRLFRILHTRKIDGLHIDYSRCERMDVDASICMDIMLADFISYFDAARKIGHIVFPKGIAPRNIPPGHIMEMLFSVGAYRNLKGLLIESPPSIECLPVLINDRAHPHVWSKNEVDLTRIVEYIKKCMKRMNKNLSTDTERELYNVIGEVTSNAIEHGTEGRCYSIGYFQDVDSDNANHHGVFNFSIFNFGDTIYQTFKRDTCPNKDVIKQMAVLSEIFTRKGLFVPAKFEEETLWTLYALQEGITSRKNKRGNGSIQYIDNFFKLSLGDDGKPYKIKNDFQSKLVIISGNTRITFDGTYKINKITKPSGRTFKMVTFNNSGLITDPPDSQYVSYSEHFFPGTVISARILINFAPPS